jgi:signal peptidase II
VKKNLLIVAIVVIALLILDQVIKVYIKTSFHPEEHKYLIGSWFAAHYIENQGMAFGTTFGASIWHKLALSIFRVVAIIFIAYYLIKEARKGAKLSFLIALGFIWAGATGNLIDSMFYDFFFNFNPCDRFNQLEGSKVMANCKDFGRSFPVEVRHRGFLLGNVVDMFQFDVLWPKWVPTIEIPEFRLFRVKIWNRHILIEPLKEVFPAIFNVADASITVGVATLIIRQRSFFPKKKNSNPESEEVLEDKP